MPVKMGLGYGLPHPQLTPFIPEGRCAFWGGWGGSIVLADADRRMIIYGSAEFGFVQFGDTFTSGSSMISTRSAAQ